MPDDIGRIELAGQVTLTFLFCLACKRPMRHKGGDAYKPPDGGFTIGSPFEKPVYTYSCDRCGVEVRDEMFYPVVGFKVENNGVIWPEDLKWTNNVESKKKTRPMVIPMKPRDGGDA